VLGVLAADCAPVLLADPGAGVIGAAHAGWKGALGGVVDTTIAAMERLGAKRERMRAVIGPCIGRDSYEVGPEFPAPFLAQDEATSVIFGMPAEAIKIGVVDQVMSIDEIYAAIEKRVLSICRVSPVGAN